MKKIHLFFVGFFAAIIALFLYSYTQVDLGLTFSRASVFQTVEKGFQYIGYFNRPLSTYLYLGLLVILFLCYFGFLYFVKKKPISTKTLWMIIIAMVCILVFAYNAFSYDFFNYIFYGRIITHYQQNPYLVNALHFPHDKMLGFMHWTQNTYPYGPIWLVLTVPLSFLGFQYFLPTFFLFKFLAGFCVLGIIYVTEKILRKVAPQHVAMGMALLAFNPLFYIEMLVSAHNDSAMMLFALIGVYLLLEKKWLLGLCFVIASILTKEATIFLIVPAVLYAGVLLLKKNYISEKLFLIGCAVFQTAGYAYAMTKIEIQPWYFVWFFPFLLFIKLPKWALALAIGYSFGLLLRYVPFLYQGNWNGAGPAIQFYVTFVTPLAFLLLYSVWHYFPKRHAKA